MTRYHLSLPISREMCLWEFGTPCCNGQTRPFLLQVRKGRSGMYFSMSPYRLAPTDGSLKGGVHLLLPIIAF